MLETTIHVLFIALISFIPIVLWGYLFAYIEDEPLGNTRFFAGIFGWIIAVIPVIYMDHIATMTGWNYLNSFWFIENISSLLSSLQLSFSLTLWILFVSAFSLLSIVLFHNWMSISKTYIKNVGITVWFVLFLSIVFYSIHFVFTLFPSINIHSNEIVGGVINSSIQFVIFYYLVVAIIEEAAKHFNFLPSSLEWIQTVQTGVLYAIFVALGFSFIENILYLYAQYSQNWFWNDFVSTYFFRGVFSVIVHVLCSSVIGYYFSKAFLLYKDKKLLFPYIRVLCIGLFWWVLLHSVFDISLTFGLSIVIVLYFLWGYFYITKLLYRV